MPGQPLTRMAGQFQRERETLLRCTEEDSVSQRPRKLGAFRLEQTRRDQKMWNPGLQRVALTFVSRTTILLDALFWKWLITKVRRNSQAHATCFVARVQSLEIPSHVRTVA